jgi:hypothetical protein
MIRATTKRSKEIAAAGALLGACLLASVAAAGLKRSQPVVVDLTNNYMSAVFSSARNTADGTQFMHCLSNQVSGGGAPWGYCYAVDAAGTAASCSTSSPGLVQQINAMNGDSYVVVYFSSGSCTSIYIGAGSEWEPKAP